MASPIIRKNRIVQKEWVSAKIVHTENQQFYDLRPYDLRVYDLIDYVMYLFFDTETTWLPENYKAPLSDSDNRPRAVQLAWLVYDENFKLLKEQNHIIKPEWFTIPRDAVNIHGISNARAKKEGHQLQSVLEEFLQDLNKAHTIIAHNISFDISIIWAELYRKNLPNTFQENKKSVQCFRVRSMLVYPVAGESRPTNDQILWNFTSRYSINHFIMHIMPWKTSKPVQNVFSISNKNESSNEQNLPNPTNLQISTNLLLPLIPSLKKHWTWWSRPTKIFSLPERRGHENLLYSCIFSNRPRKKLLYWLLRA